MFEFFDIENDPHETINLSDNPEYKDLLEQYISKIKDFQSKQVIPGFKWDHE